MTEVWFRVLRFQGFRVLGFWGLGPRVLMKNAGRRVATLEAVLKPCTRARAGQAGEEEGGDLMLRFFLPHLRFRV